VRNPLYWHTTVLSRIDRGGSQVLDQSRSAVGIASAMAEAAIQFEKGLEGLSKLSESKRREEHELDLRAGLGPALIATKGWSAHKLDENYARATIVAEQLGRVDYLVPLQYGQWAFRLVRAEHKLALEHANELERIGKERTNAAAKWLGRYTNAATHLWLGDFTTAGSMFEEFMR
jgi:predicted ATPase